jgi:hypothetical protein
VSGVYAYAAASTRPSRLGAGAMRERLRAVAIGSLLVVVGDMSEAPDPTETTLRAHDRVVRAIVRTCDAAVPFRFGSWFSDDAALARDVAPLAAELGAALALVRGCDQMTARLFDSRRAPAPPDVPAAGSDGGQGARYLARRARVVREPAELATLREAVAPFVHAERIECHGARPLVATAYHLVERSRARAYAAAVRRVARTLGPVRVALSGPWPAYAFARAT